jgi:hypothetical protein
LAVGICGREVFMTGLGGFLRLAVFLINPPAGHIERIEGNDGTIERGVRFFAPV